MIQKFNCVSLFFRFPFNTFLCHVRTGLGYILLTVTTFSFLTTALHRYMSIVHSQIKLRALDRKWQPLLLCVIWLASVGMAVPRVYPGSAIVMYWPDWCFTYGTSLTIIRTILTNLSTFTPMVLALVFYIHIYIVVKRSARKVQSSNSNNDNNKRNKNSRRMAIILFVLYSTFTAVYLPFLIFFFVDEYVSVPVQRYWISIANLGLMLVSSCNPLLYGLLFKDISKAYNSILCSCVKKNNQQSFELTQATR